MKPVNLPYEFNVALLRLNRIPATDEEKALLLNTVGRSLQSGVLYLYFLEHREAVDPRDAGLSEGATRSLIKLFEFRGLIEKSGRRRGGNRQLRDTWRLTSDEK